MLAKPVQVQVQVATNRAEASHTFSFRTPSLATACEDLGAVVLRVVGWDVLS